MRTAILTIAAMMANLIGGMANAQYDPDPNPTCGIWIYDNKFGWTLATNPARMARSLTGPRPDPRKAQGEKLKVEAVQAAAVETHTPEERVRINERMQATAAAVPKANTNSPPAIKIVSSEKSDESRKAMLRRRLNELQAQRRWIEEQEHSLRFAVLEIDRNSRSKGAWTQRDQGGVD